MNADDHQLRHDQLDDLIGSESGLTPGDVDRNVLAVTRMAAELRRAAAAPSSPRQNALRAQLLAGPTAPRYRRLAAIPSLGAALLALTAGVAFAALPIAAPARDALYGVAQEFFNIDGGLVAPWTPTAAPHDGSIASPPSETLRPTPRGDPSGPTHVPVPTPGPGDATAGPMDPDHDYPPASPTPVSPSPRPSDRPALSSPPAPPASPPAAPVPSPPVPLPSAVPSNPQPSRSPLPAPL